MWRAAGALASDGLSGRASASVIAFLNLIERAARDTEHLDLHEKVDHVITVPSTIEMLQPILTVVPLQLLAYYIAVRRGCPVDQPRNLAKSVTVE